MRSIDHWPVKMKEDKIHHEGAKRTKNSLFPLRVLRAFVVPRIWKGLLFGVFLLAACNREGVGSFAPNNTRVAVVSNGDKLYTSDPTGGNLVKLSDPIFTDFGVAFSPFGDTVAYVRKSDFGVYTQPAGGGAATLIYTPPATPPQGVLGFLPSGDVLTLVQDGAGKYVLTVMAPTGGLPKAAIPGITQAFVSQAAVKPKRGTNDTEFIFRSYGLGAVNMVLVVGSEMALYSGGPAGFTGPTLLPRTVEATLSALFALRPPDDITSGLLSLDGRRLILRTKDGGGNNLLAVNLDDNLAPAPLVTASAARPAYSFSPGGGHQVVYESGGGLWVYDFDTGTNGKIVDGASVPVWK